jgi:ankyrin repeat protein
MQNQSTPLHYAAANGHASVVKLLAERGADLEATNMVRVSRRVSPTAAQPTVRRRVAAHSNRRRYVRTRC